MFGEENASANVEPHSGLLEAHTQRNMATESHQETMQAPPLSSHPTLTRDRHLAVQTPAFALALPASNPACIFEAL